jgi:hypothetical protein
MDEKRSDIVAGDGGAHNNQKTTTATTEHGDLKMSPASSRNLDDTYELYKRQDATVIDPEEAKRVLSKIDWHVLPLLMGTASHTPYQEAEKHH